MDVLVVMMLCIIHLCKSYRRQVYTPQAICFPSQCYGANLKSTRSTARLGRYPSSMSLTCKSFTYCIQFHKSNGLILFRYGRVFFFSWFGFFIAFWSWYAFTPLLTLTIRANLNLSTTVSMILSKKSNKFWLCVTGCRKLQYRCPGWYIDRSFHCWTTLWPLRSTMDICLYSSGWSNSHRACGTRSECCWTHRHSFLRWCPWR